MPVTAVARVEGRAAPAAAVLSPVARDYPSRAFNGFFIPPRFPCAPCSFHRTGLFGGVVPPGNATAFWSAQ